MSEKDCALTEHRLLVLAAVDWIRANLLKDERVVGRVDQENGDRVPVLLFLDHLKLAKILKGVLSDEITIF